VVDPDSGEIDFFLDGMVRSEFDASVQESTNSNILGLVMHFGDIQQ